MSHSTEDLMTNLHVPSPPISMEEMKGFHLLDVATPSNLTKLGKDYGISNP